MDALIVVLMILLGLFGVGCIFVPHLFIRADMRDAPDAVKKMKDSGKAILLFAVGAALLMLKYELN